MKKFVSRHKMFLAFTSIVLLFIVTLSAFALPSIDKSHIHPSSSHAQSYTKDIAQEAQQIQKLKDMLAGEEKSTHPGPASQGTSPRSPQQKMQQPQAHADPARR